MSWTITKISDFLFERKGRYKPADEQIQGLKRIEKIDFSGNFHIGIKTSNTDMILVKQGDLVISGINVAKGAMGIYTSEEDIVATIHYSSYTFDKTKINVDYFKRFLKSPEFIKLIEEQVKGGIKTEIKPKHILPIKINLPDIDTQNEIVANFEKIEDDMRELDCEVDYQQNLLTKLKQSILQEAIEGKLTDKWREENQDIEPASVLLEKIQIEKEQLIKEKKIKKSKPLVEISKDEILFKIPDSWEYCRLGDICFKITDGFHHTPQKIDKGFIYISATHIRENKICWDDCLYIGEKEHNELYKKTYPQKGEILITNRGAGCGTPAIIDINEQFSFQNAALIGFNQNLLSKEYIYYFILFMREQIIEHFVNGGLQPMLSNVMLGKLPISLPSTEEQNEIVSKIEKLFILCDELEEQINNSKQNTQILMQAVLKEAFEK